MACSCNKLKDFFDYNRLITCLYGKPATGKTTLCLLAIASEENKKAIFVDTENGFSVERMKQIAGSIPPNLLIIKANNFKEQCKIVERLLISKDKIGLLIVDSFTAHYRKELQAKHDVNSKMSRQLSILSEFARSGTPVIVTSQVYTLPENNSVQPVGGNMLKKWSGCVVKLENEGKREMFIEKHPEIQGTKIRFEIVNEGVRLLLKEKQAVC